MSDRSFEVSLVVLTAAVLVWIVAGIVMGILGYYWADMGLGLLIFLTILIGLVVLIIGGGMLLHFWGKNYMSRG
ncbi:MAG: hypothetical protein JXA01_10510 [Dehalococcoidia bacterium]|nr:hypothetical protein [Dehalococcoidia bacterium]